MPPAWHSLTFDVPADVATDDAEQTKVIKSALENMEIGDCAPLLAQQDLSSEDWRKVVLECFEFQNDRGWRLYDENGVLLDEPPDCPASGFNHESLIADVGLDYYSISSSSTSGCRAEEPQGSPVKSDDGARDPLPDLDLLRVRTHDALAGLTTNAFLARFFARQRARA